MSDDGETTLETPGLDRLIKALKVESPTARVGILGDKSQRNASGKVGPNNAEIGAAHEYGTSELPQRSFLRVPISEHLQKEMENSGALDEDVMSAVIKSGTLLPWVKKIAVLAERIVMNAFATSGDGKWKPSIMTHKKVAQTLVETGQLRNSITSEVVE